MLQKLVSSSQQVIFITVKFYKQLILVLCRNQLEESA